MKKELLENEIESIIKKLEGFSEKANLQLSTAKFLDNEANKLMYKLDHDESLSFEQREILENQIAPLKNKLEFEMRQLDIDEQQVIPLVERLKYLESQPIEE